MDKYYFFRTVVDKGRQRLRALSGQKFPDGTLVDPAPNVQSDKGIRSMYPLGTTFASDRLIQRSGYYEAGNLVIVGIRTDEYKDSSHIPNEDCRRSYEVFIGTGESPTSVDDEVDPTTKKDVPKNTVLLKMRKNKKFSVPSIKKDGFYVDPDNWYLLLRNITNQINTMMIGPTGGGKTELVMLACERLGIDCSVYDMGSMYDPVAGLLGVHRLQKGGESVFDYAKFTEDIQKPGVILLDELSRAPVTTNNLLFPCLDSRRKLPVEIAGGDDEREIKIHPDCCFVATANVGAEYTGTMSMDRALINRFFPLELDYMPEIYELGVLCARCGVDSASARTIVKIANTIRSMYKKQEIGCAVSTRETLMVCELISDGWDLLKALELVFLPLFEGTNLDGERGIVRKLFASF